MRGEGLYYMARYVPAISSLNSQLSQHGFDKCRHLLNISSYKVDTLNVTNAPLDWVPRVNFHTMTH